MLAFAVSGRDQAELNGVDRRVIAGSGIIRIRENELPETSMLIEVLLYIEILVCTELNAAEIDVFVSKREVNVQQVYAVNFYDGDEERVVWVGKVERLREELFSELEGLVHVGSEDKGN